MRIPAGDVEGLVLDRLRAFFSSTSAIADALACEPGSSGEYQFEDSLLGGEFVLARRRLQFVELHLHLVEKPRRAFRTWAEKLTSHLLDLKLQMGDQRLIGGEPGLCDSSVRLKRLGLNRLRKPLGRDQARSKRSAFITLVHAATKSATNFACASSAP